MMGKEVRECALRMQLAWQCVNEVLLLFALFTKQLPKPEAIAGEFSSFSQETRMLTFHLGCF